jgi:hypothetical protein
MQNTAGASGSAGVGGGDGGPVCAGVVEPEWLQSGTRCTSTAECPGAGISQGCRLEPLSFACGGVAPPMDCFDDEQCGADFVCNADGCGGTTCVPACTATSCGDIADCELGRCVQKPCTEVGAIECVDGWECDPSNARANANGCAAVDCSVGRACSPGWDCAGISSTGADAHGCVQRTCNASSDCDCGACVDGKCEPYAGACMNIAPPP